MINKTVMQTKDGKENYTFFISGKINEDIIPQVARGVRFGHRNWERKMFDATVLEKETLQTYSHDKEMKYVVFSTSKGKNFFMVVFDKSIDHDRLHEMFIHISFDDDENDFDFKAVSAGFIGCEGLCFGRSESLGIKKHDRDDQIVKNGLTL